MASCERYDNPPVPSYAVIFRTHFWDEFAQRQLDRLKRHVRSGDIYVLIDETNGRADNIRHDRVVRFTDRDLIALGLPRAGIGSMAWFNGDYPLYLFLSQVPSYAYYFQVEYDVVVSFDVDNTIRNAANDCVDFAGLTRGEPVEQWMWLYTCEGVYPLDAVRYKLIFTSLFSERALKLLADKRIGLARNLGSRLKTSWPFCEAFIATEVENARLVSAELSQYVNTDFCDTWPPILEADALSMSAQIMHPVLDQKRYVESLLKYRVGWLGYANPTSLFHRKMRRLPPGLYLSAVTTSFRWKVERDVRRYMRSVLIRGSHQKGSSLEPTTKNSACVNAPRQGHDVTVILPVFNSETTLERAVASVLRQSLRSFELLIVDDGSTDNSLDIAKRLAQSDSRIRVIELPANGGKARAMNHAAAEATGRWIAVLDADDEYLPTRLQTLIECGEEQDVDLVADNQLHYDSASGSVFRTAFEAEGDGRAIGLSDFIAHSNPAAPFDFGILKIVVRADFLRENGLAYHPYARFSEDFYFLLELFMRGGRGWLVHEPLYRWTLPFSPSSRRWTSTGNGAWRYDYQNALTTNEYFAWKLRDSGRIEVLAMLRKRDRDYKRMIHYLNAQRVAADDRKHAKAALLIIRHPITWPLLTRRVAGRISRRVRRTSVKTDNAQWSGAGHGRRA